MTAEWHLKVADKEIGPLSSRQLKLMANKGQIGPEDLVRRGTAGAWVVADRVRGLFPSSESADAPSQQTTAAERPHESNSQPPEISCTTPASIAHLPAQGVAPVHEREKESSPSPAPALPVAQPIDPLSLPGGPIPTATGVALAHSVPPGQLPPSVEFPAGQTPPAAFSPPHGAQSPPAEPSPFTIVTDPSQSSAYVPETDERGGRVIRRKRQNAIFAVASMVVVASLAVGAVFLLSSIPTGNGKSAKAKDQQSRSDRRSRRKRDIKLPDEVTALLEQDGATEVAANLNEQGPAESETDEGEWIDATREAADQGDITVRIVDASIRRLSTVKRGEAQPQAPKKTDEYLTIRLELSNKNAEQRRPYFGWATRPTEVELVDSAGRPYGMRLFPNAARLGQQHQAEIEPSSSIEDVLLFDKPADGGTFLRLTLPATAFGEQGALKFRLPMKMVVVDEDSTEPRKSFDSSAADKKNQDAVGSRTTERAVEKEPEFGIAIPGLHDQEADQDVAEETEPSSFAADPELMKRRLELRQQQAERREQ